jgi:hypothetical protein
LLFKGSLYLKIIKFVEVRVPTLVYLTWNVPLKRAQEGPWVAVGDFMELQEQAGGYRRPQRLRGMAEGLQGAVEDVRVRGAEGSMGSSEELGKSVRGC